MLVLLGVYFKAFVIEVFKINELANYSLINCKGLPVLDFL
jgi:hypothetical protein